MENNIYTDEIVSNESFSLVEFSSDMTNDKKHEWINSNESIKSKDLEIKISVFDVASYIIKKMIQVSTMKLQKLVYYCQAWSLVWDEKPLFFENIEAWINGPVIRELYNFHRGNFIINNLPLGNPDIFNNTQKETIDSVIKFYGDKPAQYLIDLTHSEKPWIEARKGIPDSERSNKIIPLDIIQQYYSSL